MRSRTDYFLGSNRKVFQKVAVWDLRHNSNQFMVMGGLCGASLGEHLHNLRLRTRIPLRPPRRQTRTQADNIFTELRRTVPNPDKQAARHNSWILDRTWRLVDKRVSTRREPGRNQTSLIWLGWVIREALKGGRRRQVDTAGEDVERLLIGDPPSPEKHGEG